MATTENDKTAAPAPAKKRGGARAGAGRPCKVIEIAANADPLEYLQALMTSKSSPEPLRLKAAIALATYKHPRQGTQAAKGKKEQRQERADELVKSGGKFSAGRAPLHVVRPQTGDSGAR